jgi:hypothetical protein
VQQIRNKFGQALTIAGVADQFSTSGSTAANQAYANGVITPGDCVAIQSIVAYTQTSASNGMALCVWDSTGHILTSKKIVGDGGTGYYTFTFDTPFPVTPNTLYYFGFIYQGVVLAYFDTFPVSQLWFDAANNYATPANLSGNAQVGSGYQMAWYMVYTPYDTRPFSLPYVADAEKNVYNSFDFSCLFVKGTSVSLQRVAGVGVSGFYGYQLTANSSSGQCFGDVDLSGPPRAAGDGLVGPLYFRGYVKIATGMVLPTSGDHVWLFTMHDAADRRVIAIGVKSVSSTTVNNWLFEYGGTGATAYTNFFSTNVWHYLEIWANVNGATGAWGYAVDGHILASGSTEVNLTNESIVEIALGLWKDDGTLLSDGTTVYIDEMKLDTSGPIGPVGISFDSNTGGGLAFKTFGIA